LKFYRQLAKLIDGIKDQKAELVWYQVKELT